jgi:hypothetical protein
MISLVGTAIASVAALVYAVYKKTEENRELREENIRMEERSRYIDDDDDYVAHKTKKKNKKKKRNRKNVHCEYDPNIGEWVIVDGRFESEYEFDDPYDDDNVIPLNCRVEDYYQPPQRQNYPSAPREYAPAPNRQRYFDPYDPYVDGDPNRYFSQNPYNQRRYPEYQTPYGYGYAQNNIGYGWGDDTPYFRNPNQNYAYPQGGYCPAAYAYSQVL